MTQGDRDLIERGRTLASQSIDGNLRGPALQMADRIQALSAENEKLREALREIDKPIAAMQRRAEAEGARLDGGMAVYLANDVNYLRNIATQAIKGSTNG